MGKTKPRLTTRGSWTEKLINQGSSMRAAAKRMNIPFFGIGAHYVGCGPILNAQIGNLHPGIFARCAKDIIDRNYPYG